MLYYLKTGVYEMNPMKKIRYFESTSEFFTMFAGIFKIMLKANTLGAAEKIPGDFSERLMLAVTSVNQCAYCSYLHTQTALEQGVELENIKTILQGEIGSFSTEELPAVLYGQHFAETKSRVSEAAKSEFIKAYGLSRAAKIESYIMMVCFGNLCSNTVYARENNMLTRKEKNKNLIVYLLSKPVASGIRKREKKDAKKNIRN
jgi:AhpD family alkylhydroperoxidase